MEHLLHQIALTLTPQVGAVSAKTLVSYCGSAEAVFRAAKRDLLKIPGIGGAIADNLLHPRETFRLAEKELGFIEKNGIRTLFYTDAHYPARLRQCYDSPALLFFKGSDIGLLNAPRMVAVVGTRQPTEYGKSLCEEFVEELQAYGVVLVSGLAYGIDITMHRHACALGAANIGVLGHGLGSIYPMHHRATAFKMLENGGLLSEYVHDAKPDREHFPMRNRIIAGLCDALLVVETASSGGSMISAELAMQYEREVLAVPGRVRDLRSAGCNILIKSHRARLVENAADLAAALLWEDTNRPIPAQQTQLFLDLNPEENRLATLIREQPEVPIDTLALAAALPSGELAALLLGLEFKGVIRTLPGKRYIISG